MSVFTPDREGLFYRICAGLASAGANIIDARIHTTRDGMALDNLLVLDGRGQAYSDRRLRNRRPLGRGRAYQRHGAAAAERQAARPRSSAFEVASSVAIAERASTRTTVVEVNARDRPALLAGLAAAIHDRAIRSTRRTSRPTANGRRRFLPDRADGKKLGPKTPSACAPRCSGRRASNRTRQAARVSRVQPRSPRSPARAAVGAAAAEGAGASTDRRWQVCGAGAAATQGGGGGGCKAQLAPQRYAERPRLAEESAVKLSRARIEARLDAARGAAALQRRIERDLLEVLVEQILRPELRCPRRRPPRERRRGH